MTKRAELWPSPSVDAPRPPARFWLLPAAVAVLKALPYLASVWTAAPAGAWQLQIGYLPKDFLQYAAFIRQSSEEGAWLFHNPFSVEGGKRFVLLFHVVVGKIAALTGLDPIEALELSRVPLLFLFFAVLWWFLRPVLEACSLRLTACCLVAFSGGLEGWLRPIAADTLPPAVAEPLLAASWPMNGWNSFASFYNPLWIAGLTLTLLALRPLLDPERRPPAAALAGGAAALAAAWLVHPYSAIVIVVVALAVPVARLLLGIGGAGAGVRVGAATAPVIVGIALLARWQAADPGYRAASSSFFGPSQVSIFWYPLGLGLLGWLAFVGLRRWIGEGRPWALPIGVWIAAVAWLHSSPVFNGYHFLFHLHLPVAIAAAGPAAGVAKRLRSSPAWSRVGTGVVVGLLVAPTVLVTVEAIGDVRRVNSVPAAYREVVVALEGAPAGNLLAPPQLGNIVPAYAPHRAWVGHWFLTPDYGARSELYRRIAAGEAAPEAIAGLLLRQRIRYLVLPQPAVERLEPRIGERIIGRRRLGGLELVTLRTDP